MRVALQLCKHGVELRRLRRKDDNNTRREAERGRETLSGASPRLLLGPTAETLQDRHFRVLTAV